MSARVAIVLVAHAAALARGAVEVAQQMAAGVEIEAVGGLVVDDRETLGTDVEGVRRAVERLVASGHDVVVLGDLGSAVLTAGLVVELLEPQHAEHVRVAEGPFVEGAVAAGVAASAGASLEEVAAAVRRAADQWGALVNEEPAAAAAGGATRVVLGNTTGLHARPAAVLATLVAGLDAQVLVNGAPAESIFELMKLGIQGGEAIELAVTGEGADAAREVVVAAIESGLGER